jgi:hypothetical protein
MNKIEYVLKPCPFCSEEEGKKYPAIYYKEDDACYDNHIVSCGWCHVKVRAKTQMDAINAWNIRNGSYD